MFNCVAFPTIFLRLVAEVALLVTAMAWIYPRDRVAGLLIAFGSGMSAITSIVVPVTESASFVWAIQHGSNSPWFDRFMMLSVMLSFMTPFVQALDLALITAGVIRISWNLPRLERDDEDRSW